MIKLYDKTGESLIGNLDDCISCNVTEVRNGIFDARLVYPAMRLISNDLIKENIIVCKASDILLNQKFRIFNVKKKHSNTIEVIARHISFDLLYDFIENINIVNQSCEYALNAIFRNSQFSRHYRGHSDIINAQDYNMSMANCLNAIAGKEGSIIDTYGTGAEILRDNENIHVLNRRGHDNSVTIEYGKNLEGFECTEDTTDLITRIYPFAKKSTPDGETTITLSEKFVDSPRINLYSHPYIREVDLTSKFKDGDEISQAKLKLEAEKYFIETKCDIPKLTFNLKPVPLSKCVGFENLGEKLSLCDIATIKHKIYGITTQAKVIKTVFNVLTDRYENIQLGDPKASLGDLISGNSNSPQVGPPGPPGKDADMESFPDTLPDVPQLTANVLGFASVDLSWTYENKVYYNYQVFASKTENFEPNIFDLIFEGQASSFLHQVKPNETWYYRARAVNTHGKATELSTQVKVVTKKVDDFENYFSSVAIEKLVAGVFSVDYMTAGIIKGNWIDAKNLSVTDGNGKRTLDVDSFGNIFLNVTEFSVKNEQVTTKKEFTEFKQLSNEFQMEVKNTSPINIVTNPIFNTGDLKGWEIWGSGTSYSIKEDLTLGHNYSLKLQCFQRSQGVTQTISGLIYGKYYTFKAMLCVEEGNPGIMIRNHDQWGGISFDSTQYGEWVELKMTFMAREGTTPIYIGNVSNTITSTFYVSEIMVHEGILDIPFTDRVKEIYSNIMAVDENGMSCKFENGSHNSVTRKGNRWYAPGMEYPYHFLSHHEAFSINTDGTDNYNIRDVKLPARFDYVNVNEISVTASLKGWYKYLNQIFSVESISVSTSGVYRNSSGTYARIAAKGHIRRSDDFGSEGLQVNVTLHVTA